MKFQKFEISFLIFSSILVVVFNVILVALKVLVVFEIFKETSNKFAVKFQTISTVVLGDTYVNLREYDHTIRKLLRPHPGRIVSSFRFPVVFLS